jgi:hypothetical protein
MKRLVLAAAIICTAHFANAQPKPEPAQPAMEKKTDKSPYITLQGGQVMMIKDNQAEKLDKDKTLGDGTVVMVNGTVKKPDGTVLQMKEGDRIFLDGGMSLSRRDKEPMK